MVLTADQQQVKTLLTETIILLCKNGLCFQDKFHIEGLIGITLDEDDIFLININETVHTHVGATGPTEQVLNFEEPVNIHRVYPKRCRSSSVPDPLILVSSAPVISSALCQDALNWKNVFNNMVVSDTEQSLEGNSKIAANGSIQFSNIHNSQGENNKNGVSEGLNSSFLQVEAIHGSHTLCSKKKTACHASKFSDGEIQVLQAEEPAEPAIAGGETRDQKFKCEKNVSPDMENENLSDFDGEVSHIKEEIASDEDLAHSENSFSGYNSLYRMDVDQGCSIPTFGAISLATHSPERSHPKCSAWNRQSSMEQLTNPSLQINAADSRLMQKTYGQTRFESNIEVGDSPSGPKIALNCDFSRSKTVLSQVKLAKRYECSFCGKRFSATNNLRGHLVHHTGIKEFVCSICKKGFRYKQDLKRHVLKCVGESFGWSS